MAQTRILFLCTGNSARSQMAEAFYANMPATGSKPTALAWNRKL
jgi:protein-tyrosine-phosphatase